MKKLTLVSDETTQPGEIVVVQDEAMAIRVSDTVTVVVQHSSEFALVQLFESVDPNRQDDQAKKQPPPKLSDEERKRLDRARRAGRARREVAVVEVESGALSPGLLDAIGDDLYRPENVVQYTFGIVDAIGDLDLLAGDDSLGGTD